jgi:hypothetical protein
VIQVNAGEWQGLGDLSAEMIEAVRPRAEATMKQALVMAEGELKRTLTGQRRGRVYQVSKTGAPHVASAPGEAPAVLHDRLRGSVTHEGPRWEGDALTGDWGVGPIEYARRLEFGGMHIVPRDVAVQVAAGEWRVVKAGTEIKTEARPYLAPTEERIRPMIDALFEAGV